MEINKTKWDKADNQFSSWLSGTKTEPDLQQTEILKSVFFTFREQLKKKIQWIIKEDYTVPLEVREDYKPIRFRREPISQEEKNERIIHALIDGDQETLNDLYKGELPKIMKLIIDNSGTIENAKDIFQDAFVIILEKVYQNRLNLTSSFSTYLYAICRNLWNETLRRRKGKEVITGENEFGPDFIIDLESRPDMFEQVNKIILSLGDTCRQLLERYYYLNESWDQIAKSPGYINAASAKNQKYKCLERIRKKIFF
ncbi:MAG: RNA polymerase sigma factor [Mangrovibacterium sp.]